MRAGEDFQHCAVGQFAERRLFLLPPGHALDFAFRQNATYLAVDPRDAIAGAAALPKAGRAGGSVSNVRCQMIAIGSDGGQEPQNPEEIGAACAYWQVHDARAVIAWLETAEFAPAMKRRLLGR